MPDSVISILEDADRVVLSTHTRPDGDAIGSELAVAGFLRAKGKEVLILNQDPAPYNMEWLPGTDSLTIYDGSLAQLEWIESADAVMILDTNAEHRLGKVGRFLRAADAPAILVDHHTDPEDWFDAAHARDTASSTGELAYEIFRAWDPGAIDTAVAAALYTAIMTDTGSFRYSNVTPALHRIIAELMERGNLESYRIHAEVYDKRSLESLHLLGRVLNSISLAYSGGLATAVISRRSMQDTGGSSAETDGFVNHLLSVEGVRVAALLTETESGTKISFRSKGDDHVHKWAQSLGGGGHRNASGAFVKDDLDSVRKKVVKTAPKYLDFEDSTLGGLSSDDAEYLSSLVNSQTRNSHS